MLWSQMVSLPLPLPKQDPGLVETESGEAAVCISEPASWEMLARVAGPLVTAGTRVEGPRKDSAEVQKISSPTSVCSELA